MLFVRGKTPLNVSASAAAAAVAAKSGRDIGVFTSEGTGAIILLRLGLFGIQSSVSKTVKAGGSCEKLWRR